MNCLAVVGPTATGKSALAIALAQTFDGEIVSCDSTAVYRGLNIGTDKVPPAERGGVPHHLVDVVGPDDTYSAARYAHDAATAIREIHSRGRLPILAGGTGFYFRALVRGLFPGPARDDELRGRLDRVASRRGVEALYRWVARVDPESARRIQPRDRKRLVRALEVYLLTGRPLTAHFAATTPPIAGARVLGLGLNLPRPALRERVERRVAAQFEAGIVAEVRGLLADGLRPSSHALSGLVYRQVLELLAGVRDEPATRELIVRENLRYARRQLIWFRQESCVTWLQGAGESAATRASAAAHVSSWLAADAGGGGERAPAGATAAVEESDA